MKERKKRTTIKEAYEVGYIKGMEDLENKILQIIECVLDDYKNTMSQYPRNTKFVEIEVEAIEDLREKFLYNKNHKIV
jgi:hypothetical protein